jgi:hypothetical protein
MNATLKKAIYRILIDFSGKEYRVADIKLFPLTDDNYLTLEQCGNQVVPFFDTDYHSLMVLAMSEEAAVRALDVLVCRKNYLSQ